MDPLECPICLHVLGEKFIIVSCCNKKFHTDCFLQCMELKKECPMCRGKISTPSEADTFITITEEQEQQACISIKKWICVLTTLTALALLGVVVYEQYKYK